VFVDAISSVVVAKEGKGGMAVANAIGSNVFDVCLCLGIPYFIATVGNIDEIQIKTCNLTANIFTLLGTVVVVAVVLGISRWKLTKQVGGVLLAFYIVFCVWNLVGNKACD
jgi:Ca2+/Na+ antiporter